MPFIQNIYLHHGNGNRHANKQAQRDAQKTINDFEDCKHEGRKSPALFNSEIKRNQWITGFNGERFFERIKPTANGFDFFRWRLGM